MQPPFWRPPVELSEQEEQIVKRIRRAKLFVFLRHHRHELFDETFQRELASLYRVSERGQPPIAPAALARASILQAYTGASDDETIEAILMDRPVIRSLIRAVAGILNYLTGTLDMLRVGTGAPCRRTPDGEILFSAGPIQTIRVRMFCHCKRAQFLLY